MKVPIESKVSERHIEKIVTMTKGIFDGSLKSEMMPSPPKKAKDTSPKPCQVSLPEKMDAGSWVTPIGIPMIVVATMPIRMAPFTCMTMRMTMISSPMTASTRLGLVRAAMPGVTLSDTEKETSPALFRPR